MFGTVADKDVSTQSGQPLGHGVASQIRTRYLIPFVGKHFGDPAHTGTTDADKVDATHAAHFGDHSTQFCQFNLGHNRLFSLPQAVCCHTAASI